MKDIYNKYYKKTKRLHFRIERTISIVWNMRNITGLFLLQRVKT